jgi:hypothetical protein
VRNVKVAWIVITNMSVVAIRYCTTSMYPSSFQVVLAVQLQSTFSFLLIIASFLPGFVGTYLSVTNSIYMSWICLKD